MTKTTEIMEEMIMEVYRRELKEILLSGLNCMGKKKKELQILVNSCIKSFDVITTITSQDLFIDKDECLELVLYANKLSGYLRSFMNE